jgi:hypothetical protein
MHDGLDSARLPGETTPSAFVLCALLAFLNEANWKYRQKISVDCGFADFGLRRFSFEYFYRSIRFWDVSLCFWPPNILRLCRQLISSAHFFVIRRVVLEQLKNELVAIPVAQPRKVRSHKYKVFRLTGLNLLCHFLLHGQSIFLMFHQRVCVDVAGS